MNLKKDEYEREIRELIESSEGSKDWLAEKMMDYFEDKMVKRWEVY